MKHTNKVWMKQSFTCIIWWVLRSYTKNFMQNSQTWSQLSLSKFWRNLIPKGPRHFLAKKYSKLPCLLRSTKKQKKCFFLESNRKIVYFTCLRSCHKNFMKFDHIDWKILAFKVGRDNSFERWTAILNDFDHHLWNFFALWTLNLKFF